MSCYKKIHNIEFEYTEIEEAVKGNRILSMELELSLKCNFKCPYCYTPDEVISDNELSFEEIINTIKQANELGARKIILLGGEPMLYPHVFDVIDFINKLGMQVELFTNGSKINQDIAEKLIEKKVNVVLKLNTFDKNLQDMLTGFKNSHRIINNALYNLLDAGYPGKESFLAISSVICKQNMEELKKMWVWGGDRNIDVYFEMITPQGGANSNEWLIPEVKQVENLFYELSKIDCKQYGKYWDPQPPLAGAKCLRNLYSVVLTATGEIIPCVGTPITVGNIRKKDLKSIIRDSEVISNLRNYRNMIKGPCRKCDKSEHCYGCRGAAYNITGDYLASDPLCWRIENKDDITYLPADVDNFIPHSTPMKTATKILKVSERYAEVISVISKTNPFVDEKGYLSESLYFEILAQAAAAMNGFEKYDTGMPKPEGFLLGGKGINIYEHAKVEEELLVKVSKTAKFGDFGVVNGRIFRKESLIAEGEVKVYHKEGVVL